MSKKVFSSQQIILQAGGQEFRLQALVSTYGAKYVFDEDDLPAEVRSRLGRDLQVMYKGIPAMCHVVRETNLAGTIYNLRFLKPSGLLLRQIQRDVAAAGLPSPWMRGLPRLLTDSKDLPVPVLAIVSYRSGTYYLNVRNFTVGGVQLEFSGTDLKDVSVGMQLVFDLVTNGGDKLPEMQATVTHISAELHEGAPDQSRFHFGLKFSQLSLLNENRYRLLIKEHCEGLRVRPDGEGADSI